MRSFHSIHNVVDRGVLQALWEELAGQPGHRVVSGTRKFDRGLSKLLHSELHWLDIPQRVQYKLGVIAQQCLQNKAPQVDCCKRTSDVASRQRLRSANRCQLIIIVSK